MIVNESVKILTDWCVKVGWRVNVKLRGIETYIAKLAEQVQQPNEIIYKYAHTKFLKLLSELRWEIDGKWFKTKL